MDRQRSQPRAIVRAALLVLWLWPLLCGSGAEPCWADGTPTVASLSPEETVTHYLAALKAGDFPAAYDCLTKGMVQNKDRAAWSKEQQWTMQMSEAKIFDYHVYPGKLAGDKAFVPNLLDSQDKFLNQLGVPEHELYTLIREDGRWKIDQQQLVDPDEQKKWFPASAAGK